MKNQLSALIDGEFDLEEAEHIIAALKVDGDTKDAWKHYHLIGDAIRGDIDGKADFSAKIMQALESEPTVLAINKQANATVAITKKHAVKTPLFWSVAASVAAVMFVGLMVFELQLGGTEKWPQLNWQTVFQWNILKHINQWHPAVRRIISSL